MITAINYATGLALGLFFIWIIWEIIKGSALKPYTLSKKIRKMKPGHKFAAKVDGVEKTYSVFVNYPEWKRIFVRQELRDRVKYVSVIYYSQITEVF